MFRSFPALLLLLSLLLCPDLTAEDPQKLDNDPFNGTTMKPEISEEFQSSVEAALKPISKASKLTLHEGLPHQKNKEQVQKEIADKKTELRHGFHFYQPAQTSGITPEHQQKIFKLLTDKETYWPYEGPKRCPAYHPDFAVHYQNGENSVEIHLCFGCGEAKLYHNSKLQLHADISYKAAESLQNILTKYHKQLPKEAN